MGGKDGTKTPRADVHAHKHTHTHTEASSAKSLASIYFLSLLPFPLPPAHFADLSGAFWGAAP